uniref:Uncharacterized protein n=1 Tax=Branchiostoma floridae TaxID=7739 RepID=C3ZRP5_BRAFL|eukprot:XP_002588834.1 hypothetical protein BRAFLDRAFT_99534 [Branchiostoma floridae]
MQRASSRDQSREMGRERPMTVGSRVGSVRVCHTSPDMQRTSSRDQSREMGRERPMTVGSRVGSVRERHTSPDMQRTYSRDQSREKGRERPMTVGSCAGSIRERHHTSPDMQRATTRAQSREKSRERPMTVGGRAGSVRERYTSPDKQAKTPEVGRAPSVGEWRISFGILSTRESDKHRFPGENTKEWLWSQQLKERQLRASRHQRKKSQEAKEQVLSLLAMREEEERAKEEADKDGLTGQGLQVKDGLTGQGLQVKGQVERAKEEADKDGLTEEDGGREEVIIPPPPPDENPSDDESQDSEDEQQQDTNGADRRGRDGGREREGVRGVGSDSTIQSTESGAKHDSLSSDGQNDRTEEKQVRSESEDGENGRVEEGEKEGKEEREGVKGDEEKDNHNIEITVEHYDAQGSGEGQGSPTGGTENKDERLESESLENKAQQHETQLEHLKSKAESLETGTKGGDGKEPETVKDRRSEVDSESENRSEQENGVAAVPAKVESNLKTQKKALPRNSETELEDDVFD